MKYTIQDFLNDFPDDKACLEYLWHWRYGNNFKCPKCKQSDYFRPMKKRKVYACSCGYHVYPTAGTIFHKSSTKLSLWFHAIFLMSQSKNGVSAKELQRILGVAYRTAWRMARQIKKLMVQSPSMLCGTVEADETYIGGKNKNRKKSKRIKHTRGRSTLGKTPVFGAVQRGGTVRAKAVPDVKSSTVSPIIRKQIEIGAEIMTDEFPIYKSLRKQGHSHQSVNHAQEEYVRGKAHTNTIEGFWSQLKRSINGTYHFVSPKYLQFYIDEFAFRYNYRLLDQHLFLILLERL